MHSLQGVTQTEQNKILGMSTLAFTACFAVWTIFSIIGVKIKSDLGLSDTQFGLLAGTPILTGSLSRIFLGIWTDQYGGRIVYVLTMLAAAAATFALSYATSYEMMLLAALGVGLAGGSFAVGVAYVSKWYPKEKQGTALGIFGAGNVGAAVTKFVAPFVMVAFGWTMVAQVWAAVLVVIALLFWFTTEDDPDLRERRKQGAKAKSAFLQLEPLKNLQVWRFSIYYFFVFGAFVALALWLPRYLVGVYELDIKSAGMIAALYSIPASIFRAYGGHLSDKYGARAIMYWTFGISLLATFMLSYPDTDYVIHGIKGPITFSTSLGLAPFVILIFVLGFVMSLGKAAVYKHIPVYYPDHVGAVGGLVGMIGGLGGFVLPIAFGALLDLTGVWTSCFMLLFGVVGVSLAWMHFSVRQMEKAALAKELGDLPELPEMQPIHEKEKHASLAGVIEDWHPDDEAFWQEKGRKIAQRNLWISIPALLLAFSVWMVWSVVVAKLPSIGFDYTTDQLFWLAALPGLSGATLRIFYSFMVPIFGGRLWTTISTASLLIPAFGIGYAVQNPETPYLIFLVLALLCGLGGGNFASSMANIAYFFPKSEKGNALALNAGLGNLGVSVMQFLVPIVISTGAFAFAVGEGQMASDGSMLWLQNAGFIWVPFLIVSTIAAWWGMNDIASARASFAEQSVIFSRFHNWIMCILYTGTFGSFIGYSAGFPLLMKTQFPDVNVLSYAFLGPLVGALSRAGTGWMADRFGGGRVTFWTFLCMIIAVWGVLQFLPDGGQGGSFWGFFACFMALFFLTGVGNASTFQMIPSIMRLEVPRLMPQLEGEARVRQAERESAAIIAFTSAIAAYGAFFIPKAYGTSISMTGGPELALWGFLVFYVVCLVLTFIFYTRRGGLLHGVERQAGTGSSTVPAQ
ncbi:nitrate/nitrite transporter [Salaquimonas pukyongi]|uniref:nitrate/nitrite transporter n=1 Tax=Salaquimonas pukyongi TaxID=2712698 RepID=UPI00096BBC03|nr:MFS transporter [Salaquimonas pukyongi]